jgi:hypothetical protein
MQKKDSSFKDFLNEVAPKLSTLPKFQMMKVGGDHTSNERLLSCDDWPTISKDEVLKKRTTDHTNKMLEGSPLKKNKPGLKKLLVELEDLLYIVQR